MRLFPATKLTIDVALKRRLTAHLTLKERGAYERLMDHYWEFGCLPTTNRRCAAICNIHPRTFAAMREGLELLFDVDEHGSWRNYDFESRRVKALYDLSTARVAESSTTG